MTVPVPCAVMPPCKGTVTGQGWSNRPHSVSTKAETILNQGGESIQEATASSVMPSTAAAVRGRPRTSNFPGTHPITAIPKAIIYAWVNDEATLRKAGSRTDPYVIFNRRLRDGDPPDDWDDLFRKAKAASFALRRRVGPDQRESRGRERF